MPSTRAKKATGAAPKSEGPEVGVPVRRRQGRRQREDALAARRQRRRPRGDDERGPPRPSRFHHHHRGLQRVLQGRPEAAAGTLGPGGARPRGDRAIHEEAPRRPQGPAARLRPLGFRDVDARNDGHGPQPGPQRPEPPGPRDAHEERALRVGRVPPVHLDVRPDRPRCPRRGVRRGAREAQARQGREIGHGARRERPRRAGGRVQGHRPEEDGKTVPDRATGPAPPRGRGRLPLVVRRAREGLSQAVQDLGRPRHGVQRHDDGLRQHGRRLRHRCRVHPRPEDRREEALRRVPHERAG